MSRRLPSVIVSGVIDGNYLHQRGLLWVLGNIDRLDSGLEGHTFRCVQYRNAYRVYFGLFLLSVADRLSPSPTPSISTYSSSTTSTR